jgi:hypothetical protein
MNWIITIYVALLFFVLTPGVFVRLPPKAGLMTVAAVHALVFALIWHFTNKFVAKLSAGREGNDGTPVPQPQPKPAAKK